MSTNGNCLNALFVTLLYDSVQGICDPVMKIIDPLSIDARPDYSLVFPIDGGEQLLEERRVGGRGMVKSSYAVPFTKAILNPDLLALRVGSGGRDCNNGGEDGLDTPVERRTVESLDGWNEGFQMSGELVRLLNTVSGEGRVAGNPSGRRNRGGVYASLGVNCPIGPKLCEGIRIILIKRGHGSVIYVGIKVRAHSMAGKVNDFESHFLFSRETRKGEVEDRAYHWTSARKSGDEEATLVSDRIREVFFVTMVTYEFSKSY